MKAAIIAGFALLWDILLWIWRILIIGIIVGVLGSAAYTYFTIGRLDVADPRTLSIVWWARTHLLFLAFILLGVLALTFCAWLADRHQEKVVQEPTLPLWNVPYRRNVFFTGRQDMLNRLHEHFTQAKTAALTQPAAITGLGGIGKTQIAVEYAYRHQQEYQFVLWVLPLDVVDNSTSLLENACRAGFRLIRRS